MKNLKLFVIVQNGDTQSRVQMPDKDNGALLQAVITRPYLQNHKLLAG